MNLYLSPFISIRFHLPQPVSARRNPNQPNKLSEPKQLNEPKEFNKLKELK
jgi:hypothetical protein